MKDKKETNTAKLNILYKQIGIDYQRYFDKDGVEFEMNVFYRKDEYLISNPPSFIELQEKLKELLKGTGIAKITITFLDKNL